MTEPTRSRPEPSGDDMPLVRRVAELVPCSRRDAELYIEGGWVQVDGEVVELPRFRIRSEQVRVDPAAFRRPITAPPPATFVLHKPPGTVADAPPGTRHAAIDLLTAERRDAADRSGLRLLRRQFNGLALVTPMETGASGLLVFTQDRRIGHKLVEDAALVEHELVVDVRGTVTPEVLQQLNSQPVIHGHAVLPARVSINRQSGDLTGLRFAMKGYWPGQIADRCDAAGLQVAAIRRLRIGRLPLAGLPEGHWRFLMPYERF